MTNRLKVMEMEEALSSWKEKSADQLRTNIGNIQVKRIRSALLLFLRVKYFLESNYSKMASGSEIRRTTSCYFARSNDD